VFPLRYELNFEIHTQTQGGAIQGGAIQGGDIQGGACHVTQALLLNTRCKFPNEPLCICERHV